MSRPDEVYAAEVFKYRLSGREAVNYPPGSGVL